jgi:hypothetical protein
MGLFFINFRFYFHHMGEKTNGCGFHHHGWEGGVEGEKKKSEEKRAIGVVEGRLGYWCRESNWHGIVASAFNRNHPNYVCWGCS